MPTTCPIIDRGIIITGDSDIPNEYEFENRLGDLLTYEQRKLVERCEIGCAGCGAIGATIAFALAKLGFRKFQLADMDTVDNGNVARQPYTNNDIGKLKVDALASILSSVIARPVENHALAAFSSTLEPQPADNEQVGGELDRFVGIPGINSLREGITRENVEEFVRNSDIIVDGIDIRSQDMSYWLHYYAWKYRKPVITAFDIGTRIVVEAYRYDLFDPDILPMKGQMNEISAKKFLQVKKLYEDRKIEEADFMDYVYASLVGPVNPLTVPLAYLKILLEGRKNPDYVRTLQLPPTATTIGAVASSMILSLLLGRDVKDFVTIDPERESLNTRESMIERLKLIIQVLIALRKRKKSILSKVDILLRSENN